MRKTQSLIFKIQNLILFSTCITVQSENLQSEDYSGNVFLCINAIASTLDLRVVSFQEPWVKNSILYKQYSLRYKMINEQRIYKIHALQPKSTDA